MIYPWILRWVNVGRVLKIKIRTNVAAWSIICLFDVFTGCCYR